MKREWKTFGADEQGSEFEHGLGEGLLLPAVQRRRHQLHHQPAEVRVSPHRLGEVDHSSDLRRTKTKTMHDMKASTNASSICDHWAVFAYLSRVSVPEIKRSHEVRVVFLHAGGSFSQLGGL